MSRIQDIAIDPFFATYAAGALDRATKPIQNHIAPVVEVPTLIGHFKKHDRDSRLTLPEARRALDGKAVQIGISQYDGRFQCEINSLDAPLDKAVGEEDLKFLLQDALDLLAEVESQVLERETLNKAFAAVGAGADINFAAANDPVQLLDDQIHALMKSARSDGIAISFDPLAWAIFKNHPKVKELAGANLSWETTPALFAGNARFQTCYSLFDANPAGAAENIEFQAPANSILVFARSEIATRRDPSFMKTFRHKAKTNGPKVVERNDGRGLIVKQDWAVDLQVANTVGAARFNVVTA